MGTVQLHSKRIGILILLGIYSTILSTMAKQDLKLTIQQVLSFFAVLNFMRMKQTTLRHTIISTLHCSGNFYALIVRRFTLSGSVTF